VRDLTKVMPVLEEMARIGLPLCTHGEVTDPAVDIFDREAVFIDTVLDPLRRRLPELRLVMEHITTEEGVAYVAEGGDNLAATITTHHLIINRNHILAGGSSRITIACRSPSGKSTGWHCARRQPPARPDISLALTAPPISTR
jgi:dihydroorotase